MNCPICGEPMEYKGIEDGAGDSGEGVVDTWYCEGCDEYRDGMVLEFFDDESPVDDEDTQQIRVYRRVDLDDDIPF